MSAKFRFALQPLLELRRRAEEEQRQRYAARRRELDENAREINRLRGAFHVNALRIPSVIHLVLADAAIGACQRRCTALEAECDSARTALIAASRERRVLEKLRERRRRVYEAQCARREEQEIEEANRE